MFHSIRIAILVGILTGLYLTVNAQTGPAGVGSSINNVIWLDVNRETKFLSNNPVDTLTDWSGNNNHFYYVNDINQRPLYRTQLLHDKPVVRFDGNNDRLRSPAISSLNNRANHSWFIVYRTENPNVTQIAIRTNYTSNNTQWGIYNNSTNFVIHSRDSAGVMKSRTRSVTTTGFHIFSGLVDSVSKTLRGSYDGASLGIANNVNAIPTTHNSTWLGCSSTGGTGFLVGSIAEVIVYNNSLNTAEQKVIENYLSAKYNIPISNDMYVYDSLLGFGNDLVGIGRDSSNHEITLARGAGILSLSADSLQNADYVFMGHNNASLLIQNHLSQIDSVQSRWERVWRVDNTNYQGNVNLKFHLNEEISFAGADDYVLLMDTLSGNFVNESVVKLNPTSFDTNTYELVFEDVNIPDGAFFTIGKYGEKYTNNGPAGIGNFYNNLFWLDVSAQTQYSNNQSVDTLFDISGNAYHFYNTSNYPIYKTNQINGKPVLDFTNQFLKSQAIEKMGAGGRTWFIVTSADNNTHIGNIFGSHHAGNSVNNFVTYVDAGTNIYRSFVRNSIGTPTTANQGWASSYQLLTANYSILTQQLETSRNGAPTDTKTSLTTTSAHIKSVIGRAPQSGVNYFDGKIAEVILFNTSLNKTQQTIVENYLSSKYNLSISNDKYAFEASHNLNMLGIGRIDSSDFHLSAKGRGMLEVAADSLGDNEFVLLAHNNSTLLLDSTDVPATIYGPRFNRTWKADVSGGGAMGPARPLCKLTFHLSENDFDSITQYVLLVDTVDGVFANGGTTIYQNGIYNSVDTTVSFMGVTIRDSAFITLASRGAFLVSWTDTVNCIVIAENVLQKSSGVDSAYNAGASSLNLLKGGEDGWVEYRVEQLGERKLFGLAVFPNKNEADTLIEYGMEIYADGSVYKSELGVKASIGNVTAGEVLRVERSEDTIYYKINGATHSTKFANREEDLIVDASIFTYGGKLTAISVSFPPKPQGIIYAIPKKKLDASYYKTINGSLYVRYFDFYSTGKVKFNIYNQNNELVLKQYEIFTPSNLDHYTHIQKDYGSNWIKISLNHDCPKYGAFIPGKYYVLEIFDDKGRPEYVRFKYLYVPYISNLCGGLQN